MLYVVCCGVVIICCMHISNTVQYLCIACTAVQAMLLCCLRSPWHSCGAASMKPKPVSLRRRRPQNGFYILTIYVVGSVSYSSDLWPRGVGPRGSTLHLAGSREGAAGGPRPPVRPQPPGAPPPQVVWKWSDAEISC